jgi:hypothetical protein
MADSSSAEGDGWAIERLKADGRIQESRSIRSANFGK